MGGAYILEATRCRERAGSMQGVPLLPSQTVKRVREEGSFLAQQ